MLPNHRSWRLLPGSPRRVAPRFAFLALLATGGCRSPAIEAPAPGPPAPFPSACRVLKVEGPGSSVLDTLAWEGSAGPESEAWCRGTGPAFAYRPARAVTPAALSDLAIVSWNVHLGAGDLDALIEDLRRGRLDGRPTAAFVLLLQEVIRVGPDVPADPGPDTRSGRRLGAGPEEPGARSIQAVARRNGLHLLYVPSARNGRDASPAEDRGNAILSTVPLREPSALEFPVERQRRVAVSARIDLDAEAGGPTELRLINLHLDLRARFRQFHRSLGNVRTDQARLAASSYAGDDPAVLGGDLNTWLGGAREGAVRVLSEAFPLPEKPPDRRTLRAPGPLPDLVLDHLFFRLPDGLGASSQVVENRYGSDHYPVLGRVIVSPPRPGGCPPAGAPAGDGL